MTERPAWDGRLFEQWAPVRARKGDTIFRLKLWWDHLPSPEVLQRRQEVRVDEKCAYCECRGRVSTWHLLAQCQAPPLKEARKRVGEKLRRAGLEATNRASTAALTMRAKFNDAFRMTATGQWWVPPQEWLNEGGRKAGKAPNPW